MADRTTVICPCCREKVSNLQMQRVFSLFIFDGQMRVGDLSYEDSFIEVLKIHPDFYDWACDNCLDENRALPGDLQKQFYTFKYPWDVATPYFAYFDMYRKCRTCKDDFVFSKEEQKHWYEDLKFVVFSKPVNCKKYGTDIRAAKNLNTELSTLLKEGVPTDVDKLKRISEIYKEMGKTEKMKAYLKAVKKLKSKG